MLKAGPVWALGAKPDSLRQGIAAAMVLTDGCAVLDFGPSAFRPYSAAEQAVLRAASGLRPGSAPVAQATELVETAHAELLSRFAGAALVGFDGQPLGPYPCGNGAVLAEVLGLPVVWDFRAADRRLGGQGAPITAFYAFALARWLGRDPVVFLDLGRVARLIWADPAGQAPEAPGALLAFDAGPGPGALAGQTPPGRAHDDIIADALRDPHYFRMAPKWLGQDSLARLDSALAALPVADANATRTALVAEAVAAGLPLLPGPPTRVLVTGAGRQNAGLIQALAARLPCAVAPVETVGLDGDMTGAQAMAHLAVRVAQGLPTSCPGTTGVGAAVGGGDISQPGPAALPR